MHRKNDGAIAQLVEQRTENPCVPGSIPGGTTRENPISGFLFFCFCLYGLQCRRLLSSILRLLQMSVCKPPPSAQSQKPTALPCFACRAITTAILTKRLVEPIGSLLLLDTLCLRHFGIGSTATPFDSWWHHERKSNFGFSLFCFGGLLRFTGAFP